MKVKIIKNDLQEICNKCESKRDFAEALGYSKNGGGSIKSITKIINDNNLDVSHFKGKGHSKNKNRTIIPTEKYLNNEQTITSFKLKNRLIQEGYFDKICNKCGNTKWLGNPIPLELHHKDGNKNNNSLDNLELLCPNCHYFTDTYKTNNCKPRGNIIPEYNITTSQFSKIFNIPHGTVYDNIFMKGKDPHQFLLDKNKLIRPILIQPITIYPIEFIN